MQKTNAKTPATVESEIRRIGRKSIIAALGVSTQQVTNVISRGRFPPHWVIPLEAHCKKSRIASPPRDLYGAPVRFEAAG